MFVVVADNQSVFQKILSEILTQQAVEFRLCDTGSQVMETVASRRVDLFVLTMNLPDISGAELCRKIRRAVNDDCIPIIILTSEPRGQSFSEAFTAGATDIFRRNKIQYFSDYLINLTELAQPLAGRVLIVEDSRSQRQMLQQTLSDWGLQVYSHQECSSALSAHQSQPYDVILTDIELNGIENGLDLVHEVRQLPMGVGDVPIIAITAYLSESTRVNFLARGIDRCMMKPILLPELRSEIKKQMDAHKVKLTLEYERRLEHKKNQAKTDFMTRMSHELRTSLNAIIGFSDLLLQPKHRHADTREYAEKINGAGKLLLELINEMLDLSKIETGNIKLDLQSTSLHSILDKCQQIMLDYARQHQVSLSIENQLTDVNVRCDLTRLTEVILNLISNAVKYNNPGGTVIIDCEHKRANMIRINVKDNGIGISADHSHEIFQPFSRIPNVDHDAEGTGIGLAIAKQLVELMGGVLDFESESGKGSVFWVDIPLAIANENRITKQAPPQNESLLPCKVLYVDDNPVNCLLLEKWFQKQPKSELLIAANARDCLQLLQDERPDILLTDINMPGESGYWLLDQIQQRFGDDHLPVIALSAMAMQDEVRRGSHSGFAAYLTKPFDFKVLTKTLNRLRASTDLSHQPGQATSQITPEIHH